MSPGIGWLIDWLNELYTAHIFSSIKCQRVKIETGLCSFYLYVCSWKSNSYMPSYATLSTPMSIIVVDQWIMYGEKKMNTNMTDENYTKTTIIHTYEFVSSRQS